jgi:hypothetical protein
VSDLVTGIAALVAALAALTFFGIGKRLEASTIQRVLTRFADASGYRTRATEVPEAIEVLHEDVPVTLGLRRGPAADGWEPVLYARAPWALGGGPSFSASPMDETSFAQPADGTVTLRARVERTYSLTGQHREAKKVLVPVLDRTDTSELTTPRFTATSTDVTVELPGGVPTDDDASRAKLRQLVVLTARLALFGIDVLRPYAESLGGRVLVEPGRRPPLHGRFRREGLEGTIELGPDPQGPELRLTARARRPAPELEDVIAGLGSPERRALASNLCRRAEVSTERGQVVLVLPSLPDPDELEEAAEILAGLAGTAREPGPFR